MSTITLTVEGSAVGVLTVPVELAPAQSDRLMAYLVGTYGTKQVDGETVPRTAQEMVEAYWSGIVRGTLDNVVRFEKDEAAKAAAAAVQDFTL